LEEIIVHESNVQHTFM